MSGEAATVITDRDRADILAGTAGVSNNNKNECIRLRWASFQGRRIVNTGSLLAWLTETLKGGVQTGWGAGLCVQVPWASWRGVAQKKVGNRFNVYASSKTVWKKATCSISYPFFFLHKSLCAEEWWDVALIWWEPSISQCQQDGVFTNAWLYRQSVIDGLTVAGWKMLTYCPTLIGTWFKTLKKNN